MFELITNKISLLDYLNKELGLNISEQELPKNISCPTHKDSKPNFRLYNPNEGYCFGCGRAYDAISLHQALTHESEIATVEYLALRFNLPEVFGLKTNPRKYNYDGPEYKYIERMVIEKFIGSLLGIFKIFPHRRFEQKDFQQKLSYFLYLMRKHIGKIEENFLYGPDLSSNDAHSDIPTKTPRNTTITINQKTIHYTKIKNQEKEFREFLHKNISFPTTDEIDMDCLFPSVFNKEGSVGESIFMLNILSKYVAICCGEDFNFLCFMGDNADIDSLFDFFVNLNIFDTKFITNGNNAIEHYKNFNMQVLHKKYKFVSFKKLVTKSIRDFKKCKNSDKQIKCKGCKEPKSQEEFYLVDSGLGIEGIENLRFEICKECIDKYQRVRKKNKYFDWQFIACYYVALDFSDDFKTISQNINSGMPKGSTIMAVQNFLALFGKPNGLPNFSQQHARVFHTLQNLNGESLKDIVTTILEIDSETFKQSR